MFTDKKNEFQGEWFLPNKSEKLQGIFVIDRENHTQTLTLFTKIDFSGIALIQQNTPKDQTTIFGKSNLPITLSNCYLKSSKLAGKDLFKIVFDVKYSFIGGIIDNPWKAPITSLTCRFPYLSSWYDTNRSFLGKSDFEIEEIEYPNKIKNCLDEDDYYNYQLVSNIKPNTPRRELIDEIKISENLIIKIERYYHKEGEFFPTNKGVISVKHSVHFISPNGSTFEELRDSAYKFLQLMKLARRELLFFEIESLVISKENCIDSIDLFSINQDDIAIWLNSFSSIDKRKLVKIGSINQSSFLFFGGEKNYKSLRNIIGSWFLNFDKFFSVYSIFLDTFEWFQNTDANLSYVMFNNRLLNLIQALESYHKITNPDVLGENKKDVILKAEGILEEISNEADKKWLYERVEPKYIRLRKRLQSLIFIEFADLSDYIFINKDDKKGFINKLIELRNPLSHGEVIDIPSEKVSIYYNKALLILLFCILKSLNLTSDEIKKMVFIDFNPYSDMVRYIRAKNK